jgi:hypothetical protein
MRRSRHYFGMVRMLMLLGIAALIASPASASLKPDPKPIPRPQPAPPPPVFHRVAPTPVVVHAASAERAAATRRAARAQAAHLARLRAARAQGARAKAARDGAQKKRIETRRGAHLRREAIVSRPKTKAAVPNPFLPVLLACAIAFLILAATPAAIPLARRFARARRGVRHAA